MRDLMDEVVAEAREVHQAHQTGQPRGPVTGFKRLDDSIGGALARCGVNAVLGNAGAGKTTFCGQIAAVCGCPAVYVTTEIGPAELLRWHMARVTGEFLGRLKSGEKSPAEIERLVQRTVERLAQLRHRWTR